MYQHTIAIFCIGTYVPTSTSNSRLLRRYVRTHYVIWKNRVVVWVYPHIPECPPKTYHAPVGEDLDHDRECVWGRGREGDYRGYVGVGVIVLFFFYFLFSSSLGGIIGG